jgi:four helix bundle protein
MQKAELLSRTKTFSLRILKLVDHLPRTAGRRAIANQLVRSRTSVGANYRARSRAEFSAKLGVVAEECDETVYWLELISDGDLLPEPRLTELLKEANELTAIFTSARRTSSKPNVKNQTSKILA